MRRTRMLTWQGTAIVRDPIRKETDPEIAVGDLVDHQVEVVENQNNVKIVNPAANTTVFRTVILIVDLTIRTTVNLTVRPTVRVTADQ
jgi:hypothetical protein